MVRTDTIDMMTIIGPGVTAMDTTTIVHVIGAATAIGVGTVMTIKLRQT